MLEDFYDFIQEFGKIHQLRTATKTRIQSLLNAGEPSRQADNRDNLKTLRSNSNFIKLEFSPSPRESM